jgi:hypothetical protein
MRTLLSMRTYHRIQSRCVQTVTICCWAVESNHWLGPIGHGLDALASGAFKCAAVGRYKCFVFYCVCGSPQFVSRKAVKQGGYTSLGDLDLHLASRDDLDMAASVLAVLMAASVAPEECFIGLLWTNTDVAPVPNSQCGHAVSPTVMHYSLTQCEQACQQHPTCTAVNYGNYNGGGECSFYACPCGKNMKPASKSAQTSTGCILTRYCPSLLIPL